MSGIRRQRRLEAAQAQRVAEHEHAGQRHGRRTQHRRQQDTGNRVKHAGRNRVRVHQAPVEEAVAVLRRYSAVALLGFLLVAISGVLNAAVRLHGFSDLGTSYGLLIVAKACLTALLGLAGAAHRLWLIPRVEDGRLSAFRGIWQVIAAELIIMAGAAGLAVTLSRTAPPVSEELPPTASPARIITWYEMPPQPHGIGSA